MSGITPNDATEAADALDLLCDLDEGENTNDVELRRIAGVLRALGQPQGVDSTYRLFVSEDRCTLVRAWVEQVDVTGFGSPGEMEIIPGATVVEVATRDSQGHTWGPPITLAEEKV